ncbi:unnamed protein product [Candida verbasci]|uniref:DUF1776-domain-containing protein n=1 Tax=Candida verbasci TaxID=1227364 RepID=A0A9W4TSG9_9ASCO|nr:unnamed protein product [Candida verbasci]
MVAEPVQASVQFITRLYKNTNDFINEQTDRITNSDYVKEIISFTNDQTSNIKFNNGSFSPPPPQIDPLSTKLLNSISENKLKYFSVFSIGLGLSSYYIYQKSLPKVNFKRRVPKLRNGIRKDVVLIIGSPIEPLTRLIALDFEKRGFIVYLTLFDNTDCKYIQSNPITKDLNYLNLLEHHSMEDNLTQFQQIFKSPIKSMDTEYFLNLKSVLFAPNFYFPIGPIENIAISSWIKLNEKMLQIFKVLSSGLIKLIRNQQSKLILIYPNIISNLKVPYNCPEIIFQNNLSNLFTVLQRELSKKHEIQTTTIKLGNLNISNNSNKTSNSRIENLINSEIRSWSNEMKNLYSENFASSQYKSNPIQSSGGKGTNLKELYHLLYDLIYNKQYKINPNVIYCGKGARLYDLIGKLLPDSLISYLIN